MPRKIPQLNIPEPDSVRKVGPTFTDPDSGASVMLAQGSLGLSFVSSLIEMAEQMFGGSEKDVSDVVNFLVNTLILNDKEMQKKLNIKLTGGKK